MEYRRRVRPGIHSQSIRLTVSADNRDNVHVELIRVVRESDVKVFAHIELTMAIVIVFSTLTAVLVVII